MSLSQRKGHAVQFTARERVLHYLRERISGGAYPPGSVLPTERQLALDTGISRPIVRDALHLLQEQGWISRDPGHRPRVAEAPPEWSPEMEPSLAGNGIGPHPEAPRPALRAIAAVMPMDPTYPAAYNILRGIQRTLQRQESAHRLVVFDTLTGVASGSVGALSIEGERQILEAVLADGIAGIILWHTGGDETTGALQALREAEVPVIFVDRYPHVGGAPACDFVGVDNRRGAREAVNYLADLGHRRIAHLTLYGRSGEGETVSVQERYEGYRDALWERGLPFDPALVCTSSAQTVEIIRSGAAAGAPTAVFAFNDASAHRFLEIASAHGILVPRDVSVIGFDDLDRYSHRSSHLTTMYLPFEAVGERAAELLLTRLQHGGVGAGPMHHILLSTTLVVRATCRDVSDGAARIAARPSTQGEVIGEVRRTDAF